MDIAALLDGRMRNEQAAELFEVSGEQIRGVRGLPSRLEKEKKKIKQRRLEKGRVHIHIVERYDREV